MGRIWDARAGRVVPGLYYDEENFQPHWRRWTVAKRLVLHVTRKATRTGVPRWIVWERRSDGSRCIHQNATSQQNAIHVGAIMLRYRWRSKGLLGQLVIHGIKGRIIREQTYGRDPERRKG